MEPVDHPLLRSAGAAREAPGSWTLEVGPTWASWSGPLGGLVHAVATRAAQDVVGDGAVPFATHLQFLRRFSGSPITLDANPDRAGGTTSFLSLRGRQDGETSCTGSAVFGPRDGRRPRQHVEAPAVPQPEDCPEIEFPPELVPFAARFEFRMAAGAYPMSGAARPEMAAWIRLRPEVPVDPLIAVTMLDAMPPGLYASLTEPVAAVSTELSIHLHTDLATRPVDDHVLAVQSTVTDGAVSCVDEATLWNRDGTLLAQARQLRRILPLTGALGR